MPAGTYIVFPVSFTNECYVVTGNDVNGNTVSNQVLSFRDPSKVSVKVYSQLAGGNNSGNTAYGQYIALGN